MAFAHFLYLCTDYAKNTPDSPWRTDVCVPRRPCQKACRGGAVVCLENHASPRTPRGSRHRHQLHRLLATVGALGRQRRMGHHRQLRRRGSRDDLVQTSRHKRFLLPRCPARMAAVARKAEILQHAHPHDPAVLQHRWRQGNDSGPSARHLLRQHQQQGPGGRNA